MEPVFPVRPLRIALVVKHDGMTRRDDRQMGYFSYAVPGLEWEHVATGKTFELDTRQLAREGFDVVLHEDYVAPRGVYVGRALPLVYLAIDSTLSAEHFASRLPIARQADLVLVDHDDLARWREVLDTPVERLAYCVNDRLFRPRADEKDIDVALHLGKAQGSPGSDERRQVSAWVAEVCARRGDTWRKGSLGLEDYAESLAGARVAVNWPRTPRNRPHRVFDAMASRAALLTGPLPAVSDDGIVEGVHARTFTDAASLEAHLERLLDEHEWEAVADAGYALVQDRHTWTVRAAQLRAILLAAFPALWESVGG